MAFIPLNRRFTRWRVGDNTVMNWFRYFFQRNRDLGWDALLQSKRVVVLAEGGSGKSTEFEIYHRHLLEQAAFSFSTTVKKVGSDQFESALSSRDNARLKKWLASNEPAWFFVDSIDEAKLDSIPFRDALNHIADAIYGAENRAHVIISGRHTEWEAIRDQDDLEKILPVHSQDAQSKGRPDDLLLQILNLAPAIASKIERPLVVVMAPLDVDQVRTFAESNAVSDVDSFVSNVENSRLWPFASRPVDLDWLISYWKIHGRFGTLAAMLQLSLSDRLRERDPKRERQVLLSDQDAMRALERIGAALVLGKKDTIGLIDKGRKIGEKIDGISLAEVLSDLLPRERMDLINRAIFVPAKVGSTRLHNDNTSTVRSFLCARWIAHLLDNNLPVNSLLRLLFATTYDVDVVRPTMRETAAWLAIDNPVVAQQILKRDPLLLMQAGDPSSLPLALREQVLAAALKAVAEQPHNRVLNRDALQRFANSDMDGAIRKHWQNSHGTPAVARILLELIEAAELAGCASIALSVAKDMHAGSELHVLAIKALLALSTADALAEYRAFLLANYQRFEHNTLWFAVSRLFPLELSVDDLIAMMPSLYIKGSRHSLEYYGPKLVRQIEVLDDVMKLLRHFMSQLPHFPESMSDSKFEEVQPSIEILKALAIRSLDLDDATAPQDQVLLLQTWCDLAALRHPVHAASKIDLQTRLRSKPESRRAWLWLAVKLYSASELAKAEPLEALPQLFMNLAFAPRLLAEDVTWLMQDLQTREAQGEKKIIFDLLQEVCYQSGNPIELVKEIKEVACRYHFLRAAVDNWTPLPAETPSKIKLLHDAQQLETERLTNEEKRSWISFANSIRENPMQVRDWAISVNGTSDPRMIKLWTILTKKNEDGLLKSAPDIGTLRGIFEDDVVEIIRDVFVNIWRATTPKLDVDEAVFMSVSRSFTDLIGFAGISLEAQADANWATRLKSDEARKAAVYATFAIDGFPEWMPDLCVSHPEICANVILSDLAKDLEPRLKIGRRHSLARVARSDHRILSLIERDIWKAIEASNPMPTDLLPALIGILLNVTADHERLFRLISNRINSANPIEVNLEYLAAGFSIEADKSSELLFGLLRQLDATKSTAIARALIPKIFGNPVKNEPPRISRISIAHLENLVLLAYSSIPPSEDVPRASGQAFTPDDRDFASHAREQALKLLADTPGKGSYSALSRLIEIPAFSTIKSYLKDLARKRAEQDSENEAWRESDVLNFEKNFEALPRTPSDLQRVVGDRLANLQYDLIHSDFGQASTVAILENEKEVQRWLANELRKGQGYGFSIEREPLTIDEKEPDFRIRAKASDASLPVEIKVVESWSLKELEAALTEQLMGRYLRDRNDRWGILLLVHQELRPHGWKGPNGDFLTLTEVVNHLESIAICLSNAVVDGPQMNICLIDVTSTSFPPQAAATYN